MGHTPAIGTQVAFIHSVYGRMTGVVVRQFKNGKLQVECERRLSSADGESGIRKATYNVPISDMEGNPGYESDLAKYTARGQLNTLVPVADALAILDRVDGSALDPRRRVQLGTARDALRTILGR